LIFPITDYEITRWTYRDVRPIYRLLADQEARMKNHFVRFVFLLAVLAFALDTGVEVIFAFQLAG
jgi:hypothetical protein